MTDPKAKRTATIALLLYIAFDLILPLIPVHLGKHSLQTILLVKALLTLIPTAIFMLLQVWLSQSLVALRLKPSLSIAILISGIVMWFLADPLIHGSHHYSYHLNYLIFTIHSTVLSLILTVGLTAAGILLSKIIREKNVVLPVALVAMPIDFVGAMTNIGFTHDVVKYAPNVVQKVSVAVPAIAGIGTVSLIGPGDVMFMALFFTAIQEFNMNLRGTFYWMTGLLTLAMFAVILTPYPVAALVPMGAAVIIANWKYFSLKREEKIALAQAAGIVFAIVGGFYVYSHLVLFHRH